MLKKINEHFYKYLDGGSGMLFSLKYGDRGVLSAGKSWYLSVVYGGEKISIASFVTKDDGYSCYRDDTGGKLWSFQDLIVEANNMVRGMITN